MRIIVYAAIVFVALVGIITCVVAFLTGTFRGWEWNETAKSFFGIGVAFGLIIGGMMIANAFIKKQ